MIHWVLTKGLITLTSTGGTDGGRQTGMRWITSLRLMYSFPVLAVSTPDSRLPTPSYFPSSTFNPN